MKRIVGVKRAGGIFLALTAALWVFCGDAFAGDATVTLTRQYYVENESQVLDLNAVQPDKEIAFEFSFTNANRTNYEVTIYNADGSLFEEKSSDGTTPLPNWTGTQTVRLEKIPAGGRAEGTFTVTDASGAETTKTWELRATGTPEPTPPDVPSSGGGGGGGCSTSFGAGTLVLLAALMLAGKTRR
jgi:hypothetical protein